MDPKYLHDIISDESRPAEERIAEVAIWLEVNPDQTFLALAGVMVHNWQLLQKVGKILEVLKKMQRRII
jgi:hypothetical protein